METKTYSKEKKMKAKELIEELSKLDPDQDILIEIHDMEWGTDSLHQVVHIDDNVLVPDPWGN